MQRRRLGQTDLEVSVLGLGTVKFGRNEGVKYPNPFDLPTDKELKALLAIAADAGINLLDTAPAYGESEARLGQLLNNTRHQWILASKVGEYFAQGESRYDFQSPSVRDSVHASLKRLKTDYIDIILVHSDGRDESIIREDHIFDALSVLKQEGKIRAFGMSSKTIAGGLLTLQKADVAMVSLNPHYTHEMEVIEEAHRLNKGIMIKKAFGSGHLDPAVCLPFVLRTPGVSTLIMGTINAKHLMDNVATTHRCLSLFSGLPRPSDSQ